MKPDDPRHGQNRGYIAGCRASCCRAAHAKYRKSQRTRMYLARVDSLRTDGTGTRRRIQALMALGWSTRELDKLIDRRPSYTYRVLTGQGDVYLTTATRFAALYGQLSMTRPPATTAAERRTISRGDNAAQRRGYAPPLAWDDIDTDPYPTGRRWRKTDYDGKDLVDAVVVLRILAGERLPANHAERVEATRRWLLAGGSARSLCQLQGWKEGRYSRVTSEGAA